MLARAAQALRGGSEPRRQSATGLSLPQCDLKPVPFAPIAFGEV